MSIRSACRPRPLQACPAARCATAPPHHQPSGAVPDGHQALQSARPKAPAQKQQRHREKPARDVNLSFHYGLRLFPSVPSWEFLFSRQLRLTNMWKASGGRGHHGGCGPRPERSLGMAGSQLSGRPLEGPHCLRSPSRFPGEKALTPNTSLKII